MSQPEATTPDSTLNLDGISAFLDGRGIGVEGDLRAELVSGGKSNLTFRVFDDEHRWVLRRPPLGHVERGAHDVAREHLVMSALASSAVPVPPVVALCDDDGYIGAPFYLMEEVRGVVLRSREQIEALSEADRQAVGLALVDTLTDLHDIDTTDGDLSGLGHPDGYLTRQLDRWQRQYHRIAVRDLPEIDLLTTALRASLPESPRATVIHGDYRIDNVIVDAAEPGRILAVLDWEMATLGDPLADLATLVMFWDEPGRPFNPITGGLTAFGGFPDKAGVIRRYADRRGIDPSRLDWYLCFAELRLAVILEQIHARHVAGATVGDGFAGLDQMVDQLLASATSASSHLGKNRKDT